MTCPKKRCHEVFSAGKNRIYEKNIGVRSNLIISEIAQKYGYRKIVNNNPYWTKGQEETVTVRVTRKPRISSTRQETRRLRQAVRDYIQSQGKVERQNILESMGITASQLYGAIKELQDEKMIAIERIGTKVKGYYCEKSVYHWRGL